MAMYRLRLYKDVLTRASLDDLYEGIKEAMSPEWNAGTTARRFGSDSLVKPSIECDDKLLGTVMTVATANGWSVRSIELMA
jgi:hypothetical protein